MKSFLNEDEFAEVLPGRGRLYSQPLMRVLGLTHLNSMYDEIHNESPEDFIEKLLAKLGVRVLLDESELKHIPKTGRFITVSNHPFGGLDGLLLMRHLRARRPDFRVMANFLLQRFEPIKDLFIPVNPFDSGKSQSFSGLRQAFTHLNNEGGLGIFPAGEVSAFALGRRGITDRQWQKPALRLIERAEAPVIPIYFHGSNSALFHILGLLHPTLRTLQLPNELLKSKKREVRMRIGRPVSLEEVQSFQNTERMGRYLRARTYSLGSALRVQPFFSKTNFKRLKKEQALQAEIDAEILSVEIAQLPKEAKILAQRNLELYLASSDEIPNLLQQIGRERERTFRLVGEGTLKACDLDEYDLYYQHLFLWDSDKKRLIGAYRMGLGDEILTKFSRKGLYTYSLFKIKKELTPILEKSIELGRSFIAPEYQQHRLALFALWQGILAFLLKKPQYRYLFGPVSISNSYSKVSKNLMVRFIYQHYFDHNLANYVKPRKPFKANLLKGEIAPLNLDLPSELRQLDHLIADIEPAHFPVPVLLKKYIAQNARFLGFNTDPKFNQALDGLILLDVLDVPEEMIRKLQESMQKT